MRTNSRTKQILVIMNILAWVAFIGMMIEAGAILVSFIVTCINGDAASHLYKGLNWYNLREHGIWYYAVAVSFLITLSCLKASVLYLVIKALSRVNIANPFSTDVSRILQRISYILLGISVLVVAYNGYASFIKEKTGINQEEWNAGEFIFTAGLVFIIAQIFKRGVEMQSENDLTV